MKSENQSNSAMVPFADAPPSYDNTATFMSRQSQLPNNAGRVITLPEVGSTQLGRAHDRYSCGQPLIEIAERLARLLFFAILITYAGLAIATASNQDSLPDYPQQTTNGYYEDHDDERAAVAFERSFIILVLVCSLCCTFGAMICDLPCLIGHWMTNKVMNHQAFRALDLTRWITLGLGYAVVLILLLELPLTRYPLTTALFGGAIFRARQIFNTKKADWLFLGFILIMGVIMVIWDCGHLISSSTTALSQTNTVQLIVPQQTV